MKLRIAMSIICLLAVCCSGCLSYSHYRYSKRAEAARELPEVVAARLGRIYFASFPARRQHDAAGVRRGARRRALPRSALGRLPRR